MHAVYFLEMDKKGGKTIKEKRKENTIVNYCTRERLEVLRQCNGIAPIQIMHSTGNGDGVCWRRAHGPSFHQLGGISVGDKSTGGWLGLRCRGGRGRREGGGKRGTDVAGGKNSPRKSGAATPT